jgi:NAD(P)-dependent dehydrogenase (short-subunit alcohol dehydrogenase family)
MDAANQNLVRGRTALVTGAGNGLGRAIALALARHGARVILVGRRLGTLRAVADEIGAVARVAVCDTSNADQVGKLGGHLADEEISILINNAGIPGPVAPLIDIDVEAWDEVFAINVRGVFLMCKEFVPAMVARGAGDVINVASVSGKRPLARRTPYTASKMAVIGLTTTLAFEVGPAGVMVNTLSPGPVSGPRMARNFALDAERAGTSVQAAEQAFVSRAALHRMVTEDEVAAAAIAMLHMPGLCGADIDLSAGMVAR